MMMRPYQTYTRRGSLRRELRRLVLGSMLSLCVGLVGPGVLRAATLVDLDATGLSAGALTTWQNNGTLGDFTVPAAVTDIPEVVTVDGVNGVEFVAGDGATGTQYEGPASPASINGAGNRSIEAWVHNPVIVAEETIISWGHRDVGDGQNCAFGHGSRPEWGAVGLWGGPDIGWNDTEVANRWTYIAWTYDGTTKDSIVYTDGQEALLEANITLDTLPNDTAGFPILIRLGRESAAGGGPAGNNQPSLVVAKIRVKDAVMTPAEIEATWTAEQAQFGIGDSDSDGMPDWYELRYASFLDPNDAADAALDEDSDASTNLNEYNVGTIPDDPDSDDDGAQDGAETNTGTWVSSSDTGTDPLDADTDDDGLLDGAETNTGTYVGPSDAGTDPFNTDTDADTWTDGAEVAASTDPTDGEDFPRAGNWNTEVAASNPVHWWKFNETSVGSDAQNDGSNSDYWGLYDTGLTDADLQVDGPSPDQTGTAVQFTGPASNNTTLKRVDLAYYDPFAAYYIPELTNSRQVDNPVDKTTTVEYWFKTQPGFSGSSGDQRWNSPAIMARESGGDGDMYWGWFNAAGEFRFSTSDDYDLRAEGLTLNDGNWHHVVMVKEWHWTETCYSTMYIDGGDGTQSGATFRRTTPAGNASYQDDDGVISYVGFNQNGGTDNVQFIGAVDEMIIYDRELSALEARLHYESIFGADSDGDGMPDAWETPNGLDPNFDDAALDADSDGATNITEFKNNTDPQNPDTDGDGALDGPETNTGVWVSESDRGTDPRNPDTDNDGLADGIELNTLTYVSPTEPGTNPLSRDTDGDKFADLDEIELGTNPTLASNAPTIPATYAAAVSADSPVYYWTFNETTTAAGAANGGSATGFDGTFGSGITDADLAVEGANPEQTGTALELTEPIAATDTTKFVDFGAPIPELINIRDDAQNPMEDGKTTTVEYFVKTSQRGTHGGNNWESPSIFARESGGDGDMYWGVINSAGDFRFSTSDINETAAPGLADGNWHHVVMVKVWYNQQPCISRLFIDGGELNGGQTILATTGAGNTSGQDSDGVIQYLGYTESGGQENLQYIGLIDEVSIYNTAFNEAQAYVHFSASGLEVIAPPTEGPEISGGADANGLPQLIWTAQPNATYNVQRTTDLSGTPTWETIGADASSPFTDNDPPAAGAFYRLEVQ